MDECMKKIIIGIGLLFAVGIGAAAHYKAKNMLEIKFTVGENIVAIAKKTNIPEFNVSNTDGLIQYQVMQLPSDAVAVYDRPGFEIRSAPLFSLNFRADRVRSPTDAVHAFQVKLNTKNITSHQIARDLVESILVQYRDGKWVRRISLHCPAVTGRSTYLNAEGEIDSGGCALDPDLKMDRDDWKSLFATRQSFEWLGDGVFSKLSVSYNGANPNPVYEIVLYYEVYKTKLEIIRENEKRRIALGDSKGWDSSAIAIQETKATEERNKILEVNAIKRGDKTVIRISDPL